MGVIYLLSVADNDHYDEMVIIPRAEIRRVMLAKYEPELEDDESWQEHEDHWHVRVDTVTDIFEYVFVHGMSEQERFQIYEEFAYNDYDGDITYLYKDKQGTLVRREGRPERTTGRAWTEVDLPEPAPPKKGRRRG